MELWSGSRWNNYGSVEQDPLNSVVKRVLGPYVLQVGILALLFVYANNGADSSDRNAIERGSRGYMSLENWNWAKVEDRRVLDEIRRGRKESIERTSLHEAVKNNHAEVVKLLVEACANVSNEDVRRVAPLVLAGFTTERKNSSEIYKYSSIVQILVSAKASPNIAYLDTATMNMKQTILQHSLVEMYLWVKWSKLRIYFYSLLFVHALLVFSLSGYSITILQPEINSIPWNVIHGFSSCLLLFYNPVMQSGNPARLDANDAVNRPRSKVWTLRAHVLYRTEEHSEGQ
ncbi:hypothetical protein K0M31_007574 [Melipona bicolor]|uniref:Uncharacterized protein n=1 Tax=Melipona bicolor TaxID=60889 RepID=A0AA40KW50_9HYME|nr:hypothetical protein K0M31_007574 [Melipona bicolor]